MTKESKKIRLEMRKNRTKPPRNRLWSDSPESADKISAAGAEQARIRNKGDQSRKRTVVVEDHSNSRKNTVPVLDVANYHFGRVMRVHGLWSVVELNDGRLFRCTVRRLLNTLSSKERTPVVCGDRVWIRTDTTGLNAGSSTSHSKTTHATRTPIPGGAPSEAVIDRVEARTGSLTRHSKGLVHTLVANIDQVVFVISLVDPELKPHLVDRYLASAIQGQIVPILCFNKSDKVDPANFQQLLGLYSSLGVPTLLTSTVDGSNLSRLKHLLRNKQTVFSGQSGVGKSSLLNSLEPGLGLRIREVSENNNKGRHTTTTAELVRLDSGGWVVDTPGIRQFELSQVRAEEVEGYFLEFHPFISLCRFANCSHTHEQDCAVLKALNNRQIATSRYHSYLGMLEGRDPGNLEVISRKFRHKRISR